MEYENLLKQVDTGTFSNHHSRVREALRGIADQDTSVDAGGGMGMSDFWVTLDGVEYYIEMRFSNNQLKRMSQ